jgi:molybdopterin-guanine dinucleotide biosynthesis protein A
MRQALDRGARKMQDLLRQLDVAKFPIAPGALTNLNTPNDAQRHLHGGTD